MSDPNGEDKRLVQVINGKRQAESLEEKTWVKYLNSNKRTQIWLNERQAERSELDDEEYDGATDSESTDFEISTDLDI